MAKALSYFESFDADRYFADKILVVMKSEDWKDFNTQQVLGAKYTVVVWKDNTDYGKKDISNAGDTYAVKVKDKPVKNIVQPVEVSLINPTAKVFGDFRNELSVSADDIKFQSPPERK